MTFIYTRFYRNKKASVTANPFLLFRGFSIALLIAYTGLLYALIPLAILIISGMALARWVAKMPSGMVVLNSGIDILGKVG